MENWLQTCQLNGERWSCGGDVVLQVSGLTTLVAKLYRKVHLHVTATVQTLCLLPALLVQLLELFFLAFFVCFFF